MAVRRPRFRATRSRRPSAALSVLTAVAVGVGGLGVAAANPAAAAGPTCVQDFEGDPVGSAVTGLTVVRGTTPVEFTGEVAGVLEDGIAPGVDMILADLSSEAIGKFGVWSGMSGSPVYVTGEDGTPRLLGAVSYGLTDAASSLAGITPIAQMRTLAGANQRAAARVEVTPRLTTRLAASGTASRSAISGGLRQLPSPLSISGLSPQRFSQLAGWLDDHGPVVRSTGTSSPAATPGTIEPGGNVAASLGHGYVTAAATGTVTDVCDGQVLALGHPLLYAGRSTYSMHPASSVAIASGGPFAGSKVANLGAPVGTFTQDRLAGVGGALGPVPTSFPVTATARDGARSVSGTTQVTVADLVADAGLANTFAVNDRALDRTGKGSATAAWTIKGTRRNGSAFSFSHRDVYASNDDITSGPIADLALQLESLLANETEAVDITGLTVSTTFADDATQWRIGRTYQHVRGAWRQVTAAAPVVLKAGTAKNVRVELYSRTAATQFVNVPVTATRKSVGRTGRLTLQGGWSAMEDGMEFFDTSEFFFDEYEDEILGGQRAEDLPALLKRLAADQKNNTIAATFGVAGTKTVKRTLTRGQVVSGRAVVPVRVVR